jgi:murein L,D-transpeptidase YafK
LKTKYQQEYLELTKEVSMDRFQKAQKELSAKNQELEQLVLLKKLQEEKELDDWKEAGGKL